MAPIGGSCFVPIPFATRRETSPDGLEPISTSKTADAVRRRRNLNERNLSLIINTIPAHIYVLNTEGAVQYVNQAVMDYTGLSMEDVQQEDYRDRVIHPEDFKRVRAPRAAGLRRGAPFSTEQRVLGNDGQYRWFLVRYKPLLDEQGRIVRWYVAAFDIEDRKRAVDQLQLLANMMHSIPAAVWSVTPDGTPDIVNQGWYDYTGQTPEYVHSHPEAWMSTMHPDDGERAGKDLLGRDTVRHRLHDGGAIPASERQDLPLAPQSSGRRARPGGQHHQVRRHVH